MKYTIILFLTLFILFSFAVAQADSDVQNQLKQISVNAENSQKNKDSYEKNQKISEENVKAIETNLKALVNQRSQITENAKKADQNVATMSKQEEQIKELVKKETATIEAERRQMEQLDAKITLLNANMRKRQENLADYQTKLDNMNREKQEWVGQKKSSDDVVKIIDQKEKQASVERNDWKRKSQTYATEVRKWGAEADSNRSIHKKYEKLNN